MIAIAITGEVGAGKSTLTKLLREKFCCKSVSADEIAKSLWDTEQVREAAVSRWGSSIVDEAGNVIKSEIARIIFANESENIWCNNLLHPLVFSKLREIVNHERLLGSGFLLLEIPLLFEANVAKFWDYVIFVTAKLETRLQRCEINRNWSREEFFRREGFFMDSRLKISCSDFMIENDSGLGDLETAIERIIGKICREITLR